jgi:hypothetical protein
MPCLHCLRVEGTCERCQRLLAWGKILKAMQALDSLAQDVGATVPLDDALGAVGFLMQERAALVDRHRREAIEEQQAAQRAASEARDAGFREAHGHYW